MANILVLVGSVYGGAEFVAEQAVNSLTGLGHQAHISAMPALNEIQDPKWDALLVITSTTGQGDLPDNILGIFTEMSDVCGPMPEKKFAVVAMGDSSYGETFCGAGRQFAQLLKDLQLKETHGTLEIDACETLQPEDVVVPWVEEWSKTL